MTGAGNIERGFLRTAIDRLERSLLEMQQMRVNYTAPNEARALSIAITNAETALLWLKSVRPNEIA